MDSPEKRLESWKAIAGYLNRGVRKVQRREATESLRVHRLLHQEGPTVCALREELDAWIEGHGVSRQREWEKSGYKLGESAEVY